MIARNSSNRREMDLVSLSCCGSNFTSQTEEWKKPAYFQWKRRFLAAVEAGNDLDALGECFSALGSLDLQLSFQAAETGDFQRIAENRGRFIVDALSGDKEKFASKLLNIRDSKERDLLSASLATKGYLLPLFLNNVETVRCMVRNRCLFGLPESYEREDGLEQSLARINSYMCLTHPVYMAVSFVENPHDAPDPIVRLFELHRELGLIAEIDYEFQGDYYALREVCSELAVALLGECNSVEPDVRCLLQSNLDANKGQQFDILLLAIVSQDRKVKETSPPTVRTIT